MLEDGNDCKKLNDLLTHLWDECNATEEVGQKYEEVKNQKISSSKSTEDVTKFSFAALLSGEFQSQENHQNSKELGNDYTLSGFRYDIVRFPNIARCLEQIGEVTQKKIIILIDEWSSLPLEVQPHFAEFLHRSVLSVKCVTVKIASVTGRTRYYTRKEGSAVIYGMDIGPEIRVDLVLGTVHINAIVI